MDDSLISMEDSPIRSKRGPAELVPVLPEEQKQIGVPPGQVFLDDVRPAVRIRIVLLARFSIERSKVCFRDVEMAKGKPFHIE